MKLYTNILESLELDKDLNKSLVESVDRYGKDPVSGTSRHAKFEPEDELKTNDGETNNGGNEVYNPGETPESGTADAAKFEPEDELKQDEVKPEEVKKEPGEGEEEFGKEPDQSIPGTGELKEDEEFHEAPSINECIAKLIEEEAEAVEHYTKAIANLELSDEDKAKVEEILKDEKDHLGVLQVMLSKFDGIEPEEVAIEEPVEAPEVADELGTAEEVTEAEEEEIPAEETPTEEPEEISVEEPEEVECVEPKTILIDNENNIVTLTFETEPKAEDIECAVKKFCGEEFFMTLEPIADDEDKLVYKFAVKELNKDEDIFAEADALETEE